MDLLSIFLAGLGGTILGIVGSFGIEWWRARRLGQAACRAAMIELAYNSSFLTVILKNGKHLPLTVDTWNAVRSDLAAFLSPEDFMVVASVYMRLSAAVVAGTGVAPGTPLVGPELNATKDIFDRIDPVADLLTTRGWPKEKDQNALVNRLKSIPTYGKAGAPVSPPTSKPKP